MANILDYGVTEPRPWPLGRFAVALSYCCALLLGYVTAVFYFPHTDMERNVFWDTNTAWSRFHTLVLVKCEPKIIPIGILGMLLATYAMRWTGNWKGKVLIGWIAIVLNLLGITLYYVCGGPLYFG